MHGQQNIKIRKQFLFRGLLPCNVGICVLMFWCCSVLQLRILHLSFAVAN